MQPPRVYFGGINLLIRGPWAVGQSGAKYGYEAFGLPLSLYFIRAVTLAQDILIVSSKSLITKSDF
jgi:hypothetical protein